MKVSQPRQLKDVEAELVQRKRKRMYTDPALKLHPLKDILLRNGCVLISTKTEPGLKWLSSG